MNKTNQEMVEHILDVLHNLAIRQVREDGAALLETMDAIKYVKDIANQLQLMEAEHAGCSLGLHNLH